jgi:sugar phosphate isomerase/epimerase
MLQYSISMYSFHPLLKSGDLSVRAAMRFARSVGFQGIEMLDMYWKDGEDRLAQARQLRDDAVDEAVGISCYTVHNNLALFEEAPWRALVDQLLADVDLAQALGTDRMRVESSFGPAAPYEKKTFEECLAPIAKGLKLVSKRAAQAGIKVGLENHGRFIGSSLRVSQVIDAVGEDNFGACVDVGNFLVVDEESIPAVTRLAKKAVHVHVKDMHLFNDDPGDGAFPTNCGVKYLRGAVLGEGVVDVAKCVDILVKAGYSGWLSLEFEGRENLFFAVARSYENLSEAVRRLSFKV